MGRVLKVRHLALDKAFALKLPRAPSARKESIRELFYREARLASSLSHSNICSIVDFGEDPVFGLFMVMELLRGKGLKQRLQQDGRLTPRVAADIIAQVSEALRYVHSRGIVHGDIKSENILLTRSADRQRVVKLLDFGLAHPDGEERSKVEGTPEYLAPERINQEPASVASDIYALGILFFELLVGTPPFQGTTEDVLRAHLFKQVPRPSELISEPLDERADLIIARATSKDPAERHPSVSSFLYEVRTFCNMHGIDQRRRSVTDSARLVREAASKLAKAQAEVFEQAPIALAAVDRDGTVRVANRAFLDFLGLGNNSEGLRLPQTDLIGVYPDLVQDLSTVAATRTTVRHTITISSGGGSEVEVALILSAPPVESASNSGDIHIAIHPLGRPRRSN
jgi:serine/threonine-protein kinase